MKIASITVCLLALSTSLCYALIPSPWGNTVTIGGVSMTWDSTNGDYHGPGGDYTPGGGLVSFSYTPDGSGGYLVDMSGPMLVTLTTDVGGANQDASDPQFQQAGFHYMGDGSGGWTATGDGDYQYNDAAPPIASPSGIPGGPTAPSGGPNTALIDNATIVIAAIVAAAILVFLGALGWPIALKVYHVAKRALTA